MAEPEQAADPQPAAPQPAAPQPAELSPAPAAPPAPPPVADGVARPLDPRLVTVQRIVGWITTAVISFGLAIAVVLVAVLAPLPLWAKALFAVGWLLVSGGLGWLSHRWPALQHRHASYRVDAQGIEIRRGVLWRKVIQVPRSRVQHTDVSQGPVERSHQLGTLAIYTAGTDHAKVDLAGLDYGTALRIRDHLLPGDEGDAV